MGIERFLTRWKEFKTFKVCWTKEKGIDNTRTNIIMDK